ncbi:MAG TPA: A/G-specific adenine glycosylase [Rhodanobacteraceae bacterium]
MDAFARRLLHWFDQHGRHDLPWQHPRTPYRVWVSEVMLQQTQVATVIPYFARFIAALPTLAALAAASEDQVMALWSGLGYYRRARYLQAAAKVCVAQHGGELPHDFDSLAALPGIGRSTAGAILALATEQRYPILDGNVKRVLARVHGIRGWPGQPTVEAALWQHALAHTPTTRIADYTQAIMDLGATVCTRTHPRCDVCPHASYCRARQLGLTADIPEARPARALPVKHTFLVVLQRRDGRVLLQRRPPQGVWPRLWSLPEAVDAAAAKKLAAKLARTERRCPLPMPTIHHGFTHYKLEATPLCWQQVGAQQAVADSPDWRWCTPGDIAALGVPAPIRKWLQMLA